MDSEKDFLKDIFREMKPEKPSGDFMNSVMARVEKEAIKQQRKKELYSYLWIAAGIACIIGILAVIFYFLNINISFNLNLLNIFSEVKIAPSYVIFSMIILGLLIGDTLLRKHSRV